MAEYSQDLGVNCSNNNNNYNSQSDGSHFFVGENLILSVILHKFNSQMCKICRSGEPKSCTQPTTQITSYSCPMLP